MWHAWIMPPKSLLPFWSSGLLIHHTIWTVSKTLNNLRAHQCILLSINQTECACNTKYNHTRHVYLWLWWWFLKNASSRLALLLLNTGTTTESDGENRRIRLRKLKSHTYVQSTHMWTMVGILRHESNLNFTSRDEYYKSFESQNVFFVFMISANELERLMTQYDEKNCSMFTRSIRWETWNG